ncbi:MAG TPA: hypothetical protein PLX08_10685 [Bacteroidales bacterium]|nr:hypothetical protein [Bacteroidales bacterium]
MKPVIFALVLVACTLNNYGQEQNRTREEPPPLKERLFFGGSFGLQFGTITDIQFSPVAGIWLLPRVAVAAGPNYRYFKDPFDRTSIYGGKAYSEFIFLQDLDNIIPVGLHFGMFFHVEDEVLSLESSFFRTMPYDTDRFLINTVLAGGGIRQQMGRRSSLNMTFLWALNDHGYGIYGTPEIRISFMF